MSSKMSTALAAFQGSDDSLSVRNISKMFPMYNTPRDRFKQQVFRNKKYYTEFWALRNVCFNMKRGESRGIVGHNGAGKSTLLQIIAGTVAPTSGEVFLKGRVGAIMTMGSGFKQDFTGRENVRVLGALMNIPRAAVDDQMERIRAFAAIGLFFDKPVRMYSSGMLARLAFAVYTCLEPDILIIDEAINVGDADFKRKCLDHVSARVEKGMSLLLVSHSPLIVEQFCRTATVFNQGQIVFDGEVATALKIYNKSRPSHTASPGAGIKQPGPVNSVMIKEHLLQNESAAPAAPAIKHPVFLNSLPKSGTHLLAKALTGLPGVEHSGRHMDRKTIAGFVDKEVDFPLEGREDINIQTDFQWIERLLGSIPPGRFLTAHLKFQPKVHEALIRMKYKIVLMMRDPRDVVVSWADYIAREKNHLLYHFFSGTDLDYRITCGIQGVGGDVTGTRRQPSIVELISGHLKWKTQGGAFLVRFEDLIGEKGGGSREIQRQVLMGLADFFEIDHHSAVIDDICDSLFGGTYTFNSGTIGRWREMFTDAHKALFKEQAGQVLIDLGYETDMGW